MNKNDIDDALDYLSKFRTTHLSITRNHPFTKKINQDTHFTHACTTARTTAPEIPYKLAEAVARGLVIYYKSTEEPLTGEKKTSLLKAANKMWNILNKSSVYECEFEQLMLQDMLERLCSMDAPTRGQRSKGSRKRILIQELIMSTVDLKLRPAVIFHLANIVDPNIQKHDVNNIRQRNDFKAWEAYSREFFDEVFLPYTEFQRKHP